jgi:hypothetical protein
MKTNKGRKSRDSISSGTSPVCAFSGIFLASDLIRSSNYTAINTFGSFTILNYDAVVSCVKITSVKRAINLT